MGSRDLMVHSDPAAVGAWCRQHAAAGSIVVAPSASARRLALSSFADRHGVSLGLAVCSRGRFLSLVESRAGLATPIAMSGALERRLILEAGRAARVPLFDDDRGDAPAGAVRAVAHLVRTLRMNRVSPAQFVQAGGDWIILEVGGDEGSLVSDGDGNLSLAFANEQVPHWNIAVVDSGLAFDALQDLLTPGFAIIDSIDRSLLAGASVAYAFRPTFDYDRNLNVLGDGPYNPGNPVAAYHGWSGGANNEIWLVLAAAGQPRPNLPG